MSIQVGSREAHVTGVLVATTSSGHPHPRMVA